MDKVKTIILAAGKGQRMKSSIPKVLYPVCGKPIIDYILDIASDVKSSQIYVVLGHQRKIVSEHLPKGIIPVEQKKMLGTGDAVKQMERYLKKFSGNVLVLCGDTPLLDSKTIKNLIRKHSKSRAACTLLTAVVHNPQGYGRIIRDDKGFVSAIREDKDADGLERNIAEINVGVYCFKRKYLFEGLKEIKLNQRKKEYYLTDIVEIFNKKDYLIESVETEDPVEGLGINSREDLAVAESIIRKRIIKDLMSQGVTIIDPQTTYIHSDVKIGKDTVLNPFTYIENNVRIGSDCLIGPFARIRSGTRIGKWVEIGNFTEIVRTKVGNRCFMKHFSYLGDSRVGDDVNIGAGAITANFDGKDKHLTQIKNGAFIGCDSILIAPVTVGKNAIVGACSLIPKGKNVPDYSMVTGIPAKVVSRRRKQ